ncbi:hypothetical protein VNO77_49219 [Canavalia gladiata]|uniref:Uncharacterized protein n=1 Tax=Canavalia gladiata TaxID=3824 RepID=A0AAN9JDU9_CANGL
MGLPIEDFESVKTRNTLIQGYLLCLLETELCNEHEYNVFMNALKYIHESKTKKEQDFASSDPYNPDNFFITEEPDPNEPSLEDGFFTSNKDQSIYLLKGGKSNLANPLNSDKKYPLFSDDQISEIITFFDTSIWIVERRLPIQSYCRAITQNFDLEFDLPAEFIIALAILNKLEFSKIQSQFHIDGTSHLIEATRQKSRLICDVYDQKIFDEMIFQGNRSIDDPETATYVERSNDNSISKLLDIRKCDVKRLRQYANIEKLLLDDNRSARSRKLKTEIERILDNVCYEWVIEIAQSKGIKLKDDEIEIASSNALKARNMDYPTLIEIFRNNLIDKGLLIDRLTYSNNPLHRRDILACSEMLNKAIMVFHEMIENDAIAPSEFIDSESYLLRNQNRAIPNIALSSIEPQLSSAIDFFPDAIETLKSLYSIQLNNIELNIDDVFIKS